MNSICAKYVYSSWSLRSHLRIDDYHIGNTIKIIRRQNVCLEWNVRLLVMFSHHQPHSPKRRILKHYRQFFLLSAVVSIGNALFKWQQKKSGMPILYYALMYGNAGIMLSKSQSSYEMFYNNFQLLLSRALDTIYYLHIYRYLIRKSIYILHIVLLFLCTRR